MTARNFHTSLYGEQPLTQTEIEILETVVVSETVINNPYITIREYSHKLESIVRKLNAYARYLEGRVDMLEKFERNRVAFRSGDAPV